MTIIFAVLAIVLIACACIAIHRNVSAKAATITTSVVAVVAPVARTQDVCDPINEYMYALVSVYMYTKSSLKANRLAVRRTRAATARMYACNGTYIGRGIRSAMMSSITAANSQHEALCAARKAHKGASWQTIIGKLYAEGTLVSVRTHMPINASCMRVRTARAATTPTYMVVRASKPSVAQGDSVHQMMYPTVHTGKGVQPVYAQHKCMRPTARVVAMRHAGKARHMALVTESREAKFTSYINAMCAKGLVVSDADMASLVARATDRDYVVRDTAWAEVRVLMGAMYRERSIKVGCAVHNRTMGYSSTVETLCGSRNKEIREIGKSMMALENAASMLHSMVAA